MALVNVVPTPVTVADEAVVLTVPTAYWFDSTASVPVGIPVPMPTLQRCCPVRQLRRCCLGRLAA